MKNRKKAFLGGLLVGLALLLTSCLFESDDNGISSWLSDHGMPMTYKVQKLDIEGIKVASAEVFLDTTPRSADKQSPLGRYSNIAHDLVMDFAFTPKADFLEKLKSSDSSGAFLVFYWDKNFYLAKEFPKDSLPIDELVNFKVSWKMDVINSKNALDSIKDISDSTWYKSLNWNSVVEADTNIKVTFAGKKDTSLLLQLPSAFVDSIKKVKAGSVHLQMRLSAPEAKHVFRFYGDDSFFQPILAVYSDSVTFISPNPFRMAAIQKNLEDCTECLILHGGVHDSLVVEIPSEPVIEALSEFYGDEFPFTKGNGNDVRQSVIFAELTMARDDALGESELGLPIQVVVGSFVDSANTTIRRMENYRLNNEVILKDGHQNLIFHGGDSLTLQLTMGAKDLVNKASDGRALKFIMRMGYPFLQEKDTTYSSYVTAKGDTNFVFFNYFDYARYDFTASMEKPMTLKLWLASKRAVKEEE